MKDDDQERIKAYMAAKMAHIKMYNECMNLADGLDVANFAELVRADEREACAMVCESMPTPKHATTLTHAPTLETCAAAIRARGNHD